MEALDFSVVIDVAMTETARCADYVLPAALQYEKAEATFFNSEFPENAFIYAIQSSRLRKAPSRRRRFTVASSKR